MLGGGDMHMTQIGGQLRQQVLEVSAFTIPSDQAGHGKGVSQVMKPRLIPGVIVATHMGAFP